MTSYERLAAAMAAASIKPATVAAARRLSERELYGQELTLIEAAVIGAWVAEEAALPLGNRHHETK